MKAVIPTHTKINNYLDYFTFCCNKASCHNIVFFSSMLEPNSKAFFPRKKNENKKYLLSLLFQAKIHYLDIISGLPSYGAKCFSTNQRDGVERVLLISPRFGLSQIAGVRNSVVSKMKIFFFLL